MSVAALVMRGGGAAEFADDFRVQFGEAIRYHRQKVNLPTTSWRSISGRAHDRAFVVAGATKEALLADLNKAVDDAIAGGIRLEAFAERFEGIVAKHGWTGWTGEGSPAGRAWRARIIYETNLRTSYAAGRYAQMTDPDVLKVRPYWRYVHGDVRTPRTPRVQHLGWDGIVLRWDDPWWQTHYPPNGWMCSCGVRSVSRRELARMGKSEADLVAPTIEYRKVRNPLTGEAEYVPQGVDYGWDHAPGRDWSEGLVPPELQRSLPPSSSLPEGRRGNEPPPDLPPLGEGRRDDVPPVLPDGLAPEEYVDRILGVVGASRGPGGAKLLTDVAGHVAVVSERMFQNPDGSWKVTKGPRATDYLRALAAFLDPDEIWVDWDRNEKTGDVGLRRRYLRHDGDRPSVSIFSWGRLGWEALSLFTASNRSERMRDKYVDAQRHGALLYRRPMSNR